MITTDVMPLVEPPLDDAPSSVPPMARSIPPAAIQAPLGHAASFLRGLRDLFRHVFRQSRHAWNHNEGVLAMRAKARRDPLPFVIAGAAAVVMLLLTASAVSEDVRDDVRSSLAASGADAREGVMTEIRMTQIEALPPCKPQ